MGVKGLQSFLKNNSKFVSERVELENTSIVVDANNLFYDLFSKLCTQRESEQFRCDIYGGDFVAYGQFVREFFINLDKCGIVPILVFDGSAIGKQSTQDHRVLKEKTSFERGKQRFRLIKVITETERVKDHVRTWGIKHVFTNVVSDMGYQRIQTPFEADAHIARLANDLNCYVLTNDSDFIIYPLPKGFIMLDQFYYNNIVKSKTGSSSIECTAYSQQKLVRCLPGLRAETMPLLSILLGNDYVEAGTFDPVLEFICDLGQQSELEADYEVHCKIASLLCWLRNKTLSESVEQILEKIPVQISRDQLRQAIEMLLRNYEIEDTNNFESELKEVYPESKANPLTIDRPELMPPAYLKSLFETADLDSIALDMIFHNTCHGTANIDDFHLPSSHFVKYRPISLALTLLRPNPYANLTFVRRKAESDKDSFRVFDRVGNEYRQLTIRPLEHLDGFGSLEHLNCYSTIILEPELKKSLLMNIFRFNNDELNLMNDVLSKVFENDFVQESSVCLMLVKYIGLETKVNPKPQFVDAVILTLFFYAALNSQLKQGAFQDSSYGRLLLQLRPHAITNNRMTYLPSGPNYRRINHFISQLRMAYFGFCLLNSLFNHVFKAPRYEKFLNGTLLFRLTKLLRIGEFKLETICHEMPNLIEACTTIKKMVNCDDKWNWYIQYL